MKDGLQEDTSGVSDENTGIEEEINATMDKIIAPPEMDEDEMDDLGDYDDSAEEEPDPQPVRHHRKSARPGPVVYVPVDDMEMPDQTTSRKKKSKKTNTQKNRSAKPEYQNPKPVKKHKGARIFGLIMLMIIVLGRVMLMRLQVIILRTDFLKVRGSGCELFSDDGSRGRKSFQTKV